MISSDDLIYWYVIEDLQTTSLEESKLSQLFGGSSKKDLNCLNSIIEEDFCNTSGDKLLEKVLKLMKDHLDLEEFYERIKSAENLKKTIIRLVERGVDYNMDLSERVIDLFINDTNLCGESEELHDNVVRGGRNLGISTMRANLCYTISTYIKYSQKTDKELIRRLEKAFSWVELLMDLNGSLAKKIEDFPSPNYYLRCFAIIPLTELAKHEALGNKVKELSFSILKKIEEEVEKNQYNPSELFNNIVYLFSCMKDLNEKEAEKFLSFFKKFRIEEASQFFISYALFGEESFKKERSFKSERFKKMLRDICCSKADGLKYHLSFTIYRLIKNKNQNGEFNLDFFEKVKEYWVLLFNDINKQMAFPLLMTLSSVLKNKKYYRKYIKIFFQLLNKILEDRKKKPSDYFIHLDHILPVISANNPNDLSKTLFLFLKKGNSKEGYIPFRYEVERRLIPEIKKVKNEMSKENWSKIKKELGKYDLNHEL